MVRAVDPEVTEPKRIRQFAGFFKNYMGISTFVVAALPVPVTLGRLIPTNPPDSGSITVLTSLFCFLVLAFIFYGRHGVAKTLFYEVDEANMWLAGENQVAGTGANSHRNSWMELNRSLFSLAILMLIFASAGCFLGYQLEWIRYSDVLDPRFCHELKNNEACRFDPALTRLMLMVLYLGAFVFAEAAFVLMAAKEYLQELLGLSDNQLIRGLRRRSRAHVNSVVPGATAPPSENV